MDALLLLLECGGLFGVMLWVARSPGTAGPLAWRDRGSASRSDRGGRVRPGRGRTPAPRV